MTNRHNRRKTRAQGAGDGTARQPVTAQEAATIAHDTIARTMAVLIDSGIPAELLVGELLKLAAKLAIHDEGKGRAQERIPDFLATYFAGITPEDERRIRERASPLH